MAKKMRKKYEKSNVSFKSQYAITLISLVITIILLIILAGIGINLSLGKNGLFNKAKYAKEQYINAQVKEKEELDDLYSQILIATNDNAQVTISVEDLKKLIEEEVNKKIKECGNTEVYPVLYKNDEGWNSGSITIDGLSQYEEIGVYISYGATVDQKEYVQLIRCTRAGGNILGGYSSVNNGDKSLFYNAVNLGIEGDVLTYKTCTRRSNSTVDRSNSKIYKIVGLTRSSQIVE